MSIKLRKFSKNQSAEEMAKWVFGSTGIDDTWITEFIKAGGNKSMLISELDDKFAEVKKKLSDKMPSRSNKKEFSDDKSYLVIGYPASGGDDNEAEVREFNSRSEAEAAIKEVHDQYEKRKANGLGKDQLGLKPKNLGIYTDKNEADEVARNYENE